MLRRSKMKFEDLKLIFATSKYVELICDETFPKGIKNKLIKIDKNTHSNNLMVRVDENANEFTQAYLCQTTSDKDNAILDSLLYSVYFAKIVMVEKNIIGVDIVSVNRIDKYENKFEIGIADSALTGSQKTFFAFEKFIKDTFCFEVGEK